MERVTLLLYAIVILVTVHLLALVFNPQTVTAQLGYFTPYHLVGRAAEPIKRIILDHSTHIRIFQFQQLHIILEIPLIEVMRGIIKILVLLNLSLIHLKQTKNVLLSFQVQVLIPLAFLNLQVLSSQWVVRFRSLMTL